MPPYAFPYARTQYRSRSVRMIAIAGALLALALLAGCGQIDSTGGGSSGPAHDLAVVVSGAGHVSSAPEGILCGADCLGSYTAGSDVTLRVEAAHGWVPHGWSKPSCGGSSECTITVESDVTMHVSLRQTEDSVVARDAVLATGTATTLDATVTDVSGEDLVWGATGGTIVGAGPSVTYVAPDEAGTYTISARAADGSGRAASTTIHVPGGLTDPFSMIVVPDTQNMIKDAATAPLVDAMTAWIVAQRDARDIDFVTHVGDIVAFADRPEEWARAVGAFGVLDGVLPYSMALGDHEYEIEENMGTSVQGYLTHFGPDRYDGYDWYRGSSPNGLSHVQVFEAGGREFLHIALEWEAPGPAKDPTTPLGWARQILEQHPDLPTIITTHAYVWDKPGDEGRFGDDAREGYVMDGDTKVFVGSSGETIWRDLVEPYPQVFMVLGGHYHKRPSDDPDNGEYHQVSTNGAGLPVFEILANYQSWTDGGEGWLRIVEFVPGGGANGTDRIVVETYSPPLGRYQVDGGSTFAFDLDFARRFAN